LGVLDVVDTERFRPGDQRIIPCMKESAGSTPTPKVVLAELSAVYASACVRAWRQQESFHTGLSGSRASSDLTSTPADVARAAAMDLDYRGEERG
jgi:hypothetical protein